MLSAFTARPIVELKQRDKSRIESVLAYGDRLLIGLNTGSLRIYRVNDLSEIPDEQPEGGDNGSGEDDPRPKVRVVDLLREEEKFSRRPIQQLAIIKEANILVSLSDYYVSIHDLQTFALQERLERTKGATLFAVTSNIVKDEETGIPSIVSRLAVAVKRRIILWSWHDMELSGEAAEITLVASVKSLSWATGTKLVAGMDPGFVIVDVDTSEVVDIVRPGASGETPVRFGAVSSAGMGYMGMGSWVPKPMSTKLGDGEMLLAKDVNTLFIDADGKPLEKRQVPWLAPETLGYSYPYLLALQPPAKGTLEVRNPDSLSLLQAISLPNASILHVPQPNISLAHAGKGFLVASDRCVWRMSALDYDSQIDELVSQQLYDEAISLLGQLEDTLLHDKTGRIREIKMRKAQGLFEKRKYRDALYLFSDAAAPPARVVSLYPKSVAGELSTVEEPREPEEPEAQDDAEGDATTPVKGSPSLKPTAAPAATPSKSMFSRLRAADKKPEPDAASVRSLKVDSDAASIRSKAAEPDRPLEGKDLMIAVNELCAFLAQARVQLPKIINYDGSLKTPLPPPNEREEGYVPPFHHWIVRSSDDEEVDWEKKLFEVATLVDTCLFRAYMLARPALAGSLFRLDNFCDPAVVRDKLYESGRYGDLIDFLHGKKLHREALELLKKFGQDEAGEDVNPALRGPQRTVGYLQQLPPQHVDLILEFAEWPIRVDQKLTMRVFLADSENAETLSRERVLDFLQGIDMRLAVRYLEHIIYELNDATPDFHQRLIHWYLQRLKQKDDKPSGIGVPDFDSDEERADWQGRLEKMLRSSGQYNFNRVRIQLPDDDPTFFESRAIVLCKMKQHRQALQIYVFQVEDYQKAEDYCNHVHLLESPNNATTSVTDEPEDSSPSIYHTLLSLYLTPPPPHKPNWPPALDLLSKHGARLPASSTLDIIPAQLPVKELESYFRGRMRSANSMMNEERIEARLRGVEKVAVDAQLLLGERARKAIVREDMLCSVCHKRFGQSAIRVYPDSTAVHYGCVNRGKVGGESRRAWA
ncbi:hypothetical protein EJ06DRAFT_468444 [Trichodelitschia bisporula]|uniref:CNH domain-containing protein n=1 Tax=Trichodelitschia bisporula TaxID=703511 RepID=A0A6G1I9C7_9PEZI|nr:hypothetical protein EJ06DRAFT_468444 [Trichodelitschia bisporula]